MRTELDQLGVPEKQPADEWEAELQRELQDLGLGEEEEEEGEGGEAGEGGEGGGGGEEEWEAELQQMLETHSGSQ